MALPRMLSPSPVEMVSVSEGGDGPLMEAYRARIERLPCERKRVRLFRLTKRRDELCLLDFLAEAGTR